jgi:ribosomal-protein-alanine N-acetyltransferase
VTASVGFRIEALPSHTAIAEVLAALHASCFARSPQEPWSAGAIATLLDTPATTGFVALTPTGEAIGFIIGRAGADEGEILTLCVAPALRRRGVATALIGQLAESLAPRCRILLEVAVTNRSARNLYESLGFLEVGRRPAYYRRDGKAVDALILGRDGSR